MGAKGGSTEANKIAKKLPTVNHEGGSLMVLVLKSRKFRIYGWNYELRLILKPSIEKYFA